MTNYTPTAEQVEVAARALAELGPDEGWPTNDALGGSLTGTRDDEFRSAMEDDARRALTAAGPLVKAEAWDEAWGRACSTVKHLRDSENPNPYREKE